MQVLPLPTAILTSGDDLAQVLTKSTSLHDGDIVVISSKAVATVEGAAIDLRKITPSDEAREWAKRSGRSAEFREAVLRETARMHGTVIRSTLELMMTELHPDSMEGSILVPNAGLDESNTAEGTAIGWPVDPVQSAQALRKSIRKEAGVDVAIIISDSCSRPRRLGVTAIALTCAGIDPILDRIGSPDLFGKALHLTQEAIADQLATAANFIMGNADESTPAAIIRDHALPLSDFAGWVPGIARERDMFGGTA